MASVRSRNRKDIIYDTLIGIFMIVFLIVTLYPILNTLAVSFNDGIDSVRGGDIFMAKNVYFEEL